MGSGPNKASADEIRIKLSELCYKTISSDFIEDKIKHIRPFLGTADHRLRRRHRRHRHRRPSVKDTAIFQAHKATPVVIADQGEARFTPFAADVFHVPPVSPHLAPILNTLVGHIWGYYAALSIQRMLPDSSFGFAGSCSSQSIDRHAEAGGDVYELVLEKIVPGEHCQVLPGISGPQGPGTVSRGHGARRRVGPAAAVQIPVGAAAGLGLRAGFRRQGDGPEHARYPFPALGTAINAMSRPVDAIKHQAKTVTVGTSRISEKVEGRLFDTLAEYGFDHSRLINRNILVLKNLQDVIAEIRGAILYRIAKLSLLGEITDETRIQVIRKEGSLQALPSRVETDSRLKGTKQIIVRQGNVYIGKGRKDDRNILVIP